VLIPFIGTFLPILPTGHYFTVVILMLLVPITYVMYVLLGVDLGQGSFLRYNLYQALPVVLYVPLLIFLAVLGKATPLTFAMATLGAWLAVVALRFPETARLLFSDRVRYLEVRQVLACGLNFALPELAGLALLRIDYPILVRMVSAKELGYYAVALAVGAGQAAMASPVGQVCFHATSSAGDTDISRGMLTRQFRFLQVVFAIIAAVSMLVAPLLIRIAFGSRFLGSVSTTYWLIGAMLLWSCSQVLDYGLRGLGCPKLAVWSNILGLVLVLVAGPVLITRLGIAGMGAAMCLGQAVSLGTKVALLTGRNGLRLGEFWGFNRITLTEIAGALWNTAKAQCAPMRLWPRS
jgi:O-antigen/teichoic acid export membrane protein